jgi:hypothetical protein
MKRTSAIFPVAIVSLMVNCTGTCGEYVQRLRELEHNVIVDDFYVNGNVLRINGFNPKKGYGVEIHQIFSWTYDFGKFIEKGDTITKQKSKLVLFIRKEGQVLRFPYQGGDCEKYTRLEDFQD